MRSGLKSTSHELRKDIFGFARIVSGCVLGAGILSLIFTGLQINIFGFTQMPMVRTSFVLFVYFYFLAGIISIGSRQELLLIVTIPFLSQFYNIALGWDLPGGATSPLRLLPMIVMGIAMILSLRRSSYRPAKSPILTWSLVLFISTMGALMSMDISIVGGPMILLIGLLVPLFFFFIDNLSATDGRASQRLQLAILLGSLMLIGGNLATVTLGMGIEVSVGAGSLVGTRNMGDFNNIFTYLILGWPFAFSFIQKHNLFLSIVFVFLLIVVVALGFSRTALFLSPVILLLSLGLVLRHSLRRALGSLFVVAAILAGFVSVWPAAEGMFFFWYQRLDFSISGGVSLYNALQSIAPGGDAFSYRAALKQDAFNLFTQSPVFGHGWGAFRELSTSGFGQAHSLTHDLLVETGLLGAGLFWVLVGVILLNLLHLWRLRETDKLMVSLFTGMFGLWLLAAHTLGAQLYIASKSGIQVNIISGILFVLFLKRDLLVQLVLPASREER